MEKIKVLEMIDTPFLGGGQINLLSLAKGLNKDKFDVSVCSRDGGPLVEEVKRLGIDYFPVDFGKRVRRKVVRDIVSILKDNRFDILHTHGGVAGFFGRWAARKNHASICVVHTLHGIHYLHYRNPFLKIGLIFLERYFSRFTDAVIFVSDRDSTNGHKHRLAVKEKVHVIKNGIDFSAINAMDDRPELRAKKRRELELDESQILIGTVARLHRQKGIIYLLRAAKKICHVFPRAKILVVGGGPLEKKLKNENRKLGLEDHVWLMGERKDVGELLSLFEVFILPSLWEGLPYVLMEAAAWKKPVVATCVNGIEEIVHDSKTGILVPPRNPEELAKAVVSLLQNREFAIMLGESLHKETQSKYTLSEMIEKIQSLYTKLHSER